MKNKLRIISGGFCATLLAFWLWPHDQAKAIQTRLDRIVALLQTDRLQNPIECRVKAKELGKYFADNIAFHYEYEEDKFERSLAVQQVTDFGTAACLKIQRAESGISKVDIALKGKTEAEVRLFFVATWREQGETEDFTAGEDLTLQLEKHEDEWKIVRARNWLR